MDNKFSHDAAHMFTAKQYLEILLMPGTLNCNVLCITHTSEEVSRHSSKAKSQKLHTRFQEHSSYCSEED